MHLEFPHATLVVIGNGPFAFLWDVVAGVGARGHVPAGA